MKPEAALIRLEELCVRSEQCTAECRKRLANWKIAPDDAESIINSLRSRRFIDDARYAAAFVRDKYRFARWGRRRIVLELKRKRISDDIIEDALTEIDADEYSEILRRLLATKRAHMERPLSYEDRSALYRYALMRGYESSLIAKVLTTGVRQDAD